MKKGIFLPSLIGLLALSCTVQEIETQNHPYEPAPGDDVFYASLAPESDTKVHVDKIDEQIKTLWDEKDQISIFNKNTVNQQYEFMGETGDNAGYFKRVSEEAVASGDGKYVCAVYPFSQATSLNEGVLTLTLPKKQTYREGSYGLEANTMVSTTKGENNLLRFKNVGGYLVLRFYGSGVTLKSIKLEGRNGELLAGEATMTPVIDELPIIEMAPTAETSITLDANKVKLEKTAEKAAEFWMVVPPTIFTEGFLLTVTDKDGKIFTKETDQKLTIERNGVLRIAPIEVKPAVPLNPDKVIYYTTSDKNVVEPAEGASFGANIVSNDYVDLKGILAFDGSVTEIGAHAFEGSETLIGMTIPATVTRIGDYAFAECPNLGAPNTPSGSDITASTKGPNRSGETTFVIPAGVTSIGAYAFQNCTSLTSITIPDSVESIDASAFAGCTSIQYFNGKFASEDGLYLINDGTILATALGSIEGGATIVIPDGITSIDDYAFAGCQTLTDIVIPEGVKRIGKSAFKECSGLTSVVLPNSLLSIGESAFEDCDELISINIPSGITEIEKLTFAACMSLPGIEIPNGVRSIGASAFECCKELSNVTLPSSVNHIGSGAFSECDKFTSFDIPANVNEIYPSVFYRCDLLESVSIPEGVTWIGFWAFSECPNLSNIIIPSTVTSIDDQAFLDCPGLTSITVLATDPPEDVSERTFENTNNCPIYVPAESLAAYKDAEGWSNYASRIHIIGPADGMINGHSFVDLGDGLKWATMNAGDLLTWREGKDAIEEWGGSWRLPTPEEWQSLIDNYTWTWSDSEVGMTVVGANGNSIFLPAAGFYDPETGYGMNTDIGNYSSSSPDSYLSIEKENPPCMPNGGGDGVLMSVRPVSD